MSIVSRNLSHLTFFSDSHPRVTYFFISATKWKFDVCTYFPLWDVKNCTITSAYVSGFTVNINFMKSLFCVSVDDTLKLYFRVIGNAQLSLTSALICFDAWH